MIVPYKKVQSESQRLELDPELASDKKQDVFKLFGGSRNNNNNDQVIANNKSEFKSIDPKAQWKDIR